MSGMYRESSRIVRSGIFGQLRRIGGVHRQSGSRGLWISYVLPKVIVYTTFLETTWWIENSGWNSPNILYRNKQQSQNIKHNHSPHHSSGTFIHSWKQQRIKKGCPLDSHSVGVVQITISISSSDLFLWAVCRARKFIVASTACTLLARALWFGIVRIFSSSKGHLNIAEDR